MAREFEAWEKEIIRFERDVERALTRATKDAADVLLEEMRGLTGAIGASLEDLARADHPYAKRYPAGSGPFEDWITHVQEGDLHGGLSRGNAFVTPEAIEVRLNSAAAHTWYVVQDAAASAAGRMRPRDFVSAAIIYQIDRVAEIYRSAFAAAHGDTGEEQPGFRPITTLIYHGSVKADLPE